MSRDLPIVCIVGRPNVGKSTLFNRIAGRRLALVQDTPGVTRDRHYADVEWRDRSYVLVDTGGFDPLDEESVMAAVRGQCLAAIDEADVIIYLMDAREGLLPDDADIVRLLRRSGKPTVWAAGKVDTKNQEMLAHELYELGADRVFPVSGAHGTGVGDLLDALDERLPRREEEDAEGEEEQGAEGAGGEEARPVKLALIGRPNAGKSSLMNRLLGEERSVVHSEPGTTRDPVDVAFEVNGSPFVLVDTAGMRKRPRVIDQTEHLSVLHAIKAMERADVACLVCDGSLGIGEQEARLASLVERRGRGLVVVVNKWDLVREERERKHLDHQLRRRLRFVEHCPVVRISALTGKGVGRVIPTATRVYEEGRVRVPTSDLNRWLEESIARRSPPSFSGQPISFYYVTQPRVAPPTFVFFVNKPKGVQPPYRRFLANRLREAFGFEGTPLRLFFRAHGNRQSSRRTNR
jgi:GTP-binding protein